MFCPSCAAPNPDEAKFCNECGGRVAPPTQQGQAGAPATKSSSLTGASQQGQRTLSGMSTQDAAASMVTGPSPRTLAFAGVGIGLAGIALGAVLAYRSAHPPEIPPITSVGLIGVPTSVSPPQTELNDAGTVVPVDPTARPAETRVATRSPRAPAPTGTVAPTPHVAPAHPPRETTPTPAQPAAPSDDGDNSDDPGTPTGSGNTTRTDDAGTTTVYGSDGRPLVQLTHTPAGTTPPTAAAPTAPPPAENGVIEHGPRNSTGGYHQGDETDATGHMDPHAFQFVYQHYQSQIASCWATASRTHEVSGVTVVRVRVNEADGHVSRTRIVSDSTHDAALQACVQNAIRAWRYPRPDGGDVEVDYPLRFGSSH